MAVKLAALAAQYISDPAGFRRQWTEPALLWEDASAPADVSLTWSTHAGGTARPSAGDPIVIDVRKGKNALNALGFGITVGRTQNNDVWLDDATVSRFHAVLSKDEKTGTWRVEDAESQNGTFVAGTRLAPRQPAALTDGVSLRFGAVNVYFLLPAGLERYLQQRIGPK